MSTQIPQKGKQIYNLDFIKKIIKVITGAPDETSEEKLGGKSKYAPSKKDPIDLRFVEQFTRNGGHFLYCEDWDEVKSNITSIAKEEKIEVFYSAEEELKISIRELDISISDNAQECTAICSNCEALVAFNGGIMIDDLQTGGHKLSELPTLHIVIGRTTQMSENLHAGMARINNKYKDKRPGQITTLKGSKAESVQMAKIDHNKHRVLYLLLLEDELK